MKNLKKLLALVLVAVMVLSFGAISASAAFTDTASSSYTEAIDVLSGIGVINGTTATTYNPTGSLTRAAAAKVLTYMLLGPTNAALISSAASQTFSDVPTSHWASGYIDYCASTGIIAGTGDGTFNPEGVLTTLAFTKMLLVALGYNADIEGYVGSNWAINIASDALTAGVYDSTIPMSGSSTCTREQAAQLAFKALMAKTVQYQGGSTITIGESTITTGATRSDVANTAGLETILDDNFMQFAEKYFAKLTQLPVFSGGRNGYFWMNGTAFITGFISSDVVLATSKSGLAWNLLTPNTSGFYIGYMPDTAVTYYYNDGAATAAVGGVGGWPVAADDLATNIATIQGKAAVAGAIVNFIDTDFDNKYDVVSVVEKTVEKLAAAPTTRTAGVVNYITIGSIGEQNALNVIAPADLAKNDVILWYKSGPNYIVEKAAVVTGTVTSYKSTSVKIGDTSYPISGLATKPVAFDTIAELQALIGKAGYTFYLDNGNNIVYVVAPATGATTSNTFYIEATDSTASFGVTTYKAKVVKMDGTTDIITVKKTAAYGGTLTAVATTTANSSADGNLGSGIFYSYALNADGTYNLTAAQHQDRYITDTTVTAPTVGANAIDIGDTSHKITRAQAYFLEKVTATADDTFAAGTEAAVAAPNPIGTATTVFMQYNAFIPGYLTYTGINNVPNYAAGGTIYVLMDSTDTYAQAVICTGGTADTTAATYTRVFPTSSATTSLDAFGTPVYTYTAIVNGVVGQTISSYTALTHGTMYYCNDFIGDVIGYAVSTTAEGIRHTDVDALVYAAGTLTVDETAADSAYILSDTAVFFVYNTTTKVLQQVSADAAAAMTFANDRATLLATSPVNSAVAYVYVSID